MLDKYVKKEKFLITAIENLLRKNNFLDLYQQLSSEVITEDEFEKEINDNSNKYVIETELDIGLEEFEIIIDLVTKINFELSDFSVNDVAELFSINKNNLISIGNK